MAGTARTAGKKTLAAFDFTAIVPTAAEALPKQRKEGKDNPLTATVKHSVDNDFKPFSYGPIPTEMAGKAKNLMHRAARELEVGLAIRVTDNGDGTTTIVYQARTQKKARSYAITDVRAWVDVQMRNGVNFEGYDEKKRVPAAILQQYREAHGLNTTASDAK